MIEFDLQRQLGNLHLEVAARSGAPVLAFFGPSGSGKTSLIKMIAGLIKPEKGRIVVNGETLFDSAKGVNLPANRRQIAYVPQHGVLFPHLSVAKNISFGEWAGKRVPKIGLDALAERLEISHLLERWPAELSGGERQRVALARALHANPGLILLDEPLSALDDALKGQALDLIETVIHEFGTPVILVTHSLREVVRLADDMLVLDHGKVQQFGRTLDVLGAGDEASGLNVQCLLEGEVVTETTDTGLGRVKTGSMEFAMASDLPPVGARVKLRIDPRDVMLATENPKGISAQNRFEGTIRSIRPLGKQDQRMVLVDVVVGEEMLVAKITSHASEELHLGEGSVVHVIIKTVALLEQL